MSRNVRWAACRCEPAGTESCADGIVSTGDKSLGPGSHSKNFRSDRQGCHAYVWAGETVRANYIADSIGRVRILGTILTTISIGLSRTCRASQLVHSDPRVNERSNLCLISVAAAVWGAFSVKA